MKDIAIKVCTLCGGSGMVLQAEEYPAPANQQWCQNCDTGKAKADRVAAMVRRTLTERNIRAA